MNKKTRALSKEEYEKIIETIQYGFIYNGIKVQVYQSAPQRHELKPNHTEAIDTARTATAVVEIECSSARTTVVIAPTFEERIARIRDVGVVSVPACGTAV